MFKCNSLTLCSKVIGNFEFVTEPSEVGKIDLKNLADSFRLIGKSSDNSSVFIIEYRIYGG